MAGPIRVDGLVSGIDFTSIIERILAVQRKPIDGLQARIDKSAEKKNAFLELNISLLSLKSSVDALSRPSTFAAAKIVSSSDSVLNATGGATAVPGAYSFSVRRLAQAGQLISGGFADSGVTPVSSTASTLRIEVGGGTLDRATATASLNRQTGFDRGAVRLTDSAGRVGIVNLEGVATVQDILDEINRNTSVSVRASVAGNRLVLQDVAGGAGSLVVENVGPDSTASTLGIAGTGVAVGGQKFLFGSDLQTVEGSTGLARLNDGLGVRRNADGVADFTVTDTDGVAVGVDLQASDTTLEKVVVRVNAAASAAGSSLAASLSDGGNSLVLTDGAGAQGLSIALASDSFAAVDLGLGVLTGASFAQEAAEDASSGLVGGAGNRIVGRALVPGLNSTLRDLLNGGQSSLSAGEVKGISDGSLTITDRQGDSVSVNVSRRVGATSAAAAAGATSLALSSADGFAVGNRFRVQTSTGVEFRTVTSITGSTVGFDRALTGAVASGAGAFALNDSVEDLVRLVNDRTAAAGVNVRLELGRGGNGLRLIDQTGASAVNLSVSGGPAADLGLVASVAAASIEGANLDPQYLGENSLFATLNGGQGVAAGRFRITDTDGVQIDVDLSQSDDTTLGEAIREINAGATVAGSGVRARINDTGDGLLLVDGAPGAGVLRVSELDGGRTARDLRLEGSALAASPTRIDGSYEAAVSIAAGATLQNVVDAVNSAGLGVSAAVVFDGSPFAPYRMTLTSQRTGQAGRVSASSDIAALNFSTSVAAQDSLLVLGGGGSGVEPSVFISSTNSLSGVVPGLTLDLRNASSTPVTVTVTRDNEAITAQAERFVEKYNEMISKIREFTAFNADSFQTGLLFNETSLRRIKRDLSSLVISPVRGVAAGELNSLGELGIKAEGQGTLSFNSGTFSAKLQSNFDQVRSLFILQRRLELGTPTADLNAGGGVTRRAGNDLKILSRNPASTFEVDFDGATSVGSILQAINTASGNPGTIKAQISSDGFSIELVDSSATAARAAGGATTATSFVASEADLQGLTDNRLIGSTVAFTSGLNAGQVRKITSFDPGTDTITLDQPLGASSFAGSSFTLSREIEVRKVGDSPVASELKLLKKGTLGQTSLKGDIIGLQGDPGAASRLSERLDFITRAGDGLLQGRTDSLDDVMEDLQNSIGRIEKRIERQQESLIRKFARLESVISKSQNASQRLGALLSSVIGT